MSKFRETNTPHAVEATGHHLIRPLVRVNQNNAGEICAYEPETAAMLVAKKHAVYVVPEPEAPVEVAKPKTK
jgi:hypothetical protein